MITLEFEKDQLRKEKLHNTVVGAIVFNNVRIFSPVDVCADMCGYRPVKKGEEHSQLLTDFQYLGGGIRMMVSIFFFFYLCVFSESSSSNRFYFQQ